MVVAKIIVIIIVIVIVIVINIIRKNNETIKYVYIYLFQEEGNTLFELFLRSGDFSYIVSPLTMLIWLL